MLATWGVLRGMRLRGGVSIVAVAAAGVAGVLVAPVVRAEAQDQTLLIAMIDVGQGDAIAIRSPRGRWVLVDAGPRSERWDAGARRVAPYLEARGVREVELLVLTHPDLDHIGGAEAILREFEVAAVVGPGRPSPSRPFVSTLELADSMGIPWRAASTLGPLHLDGVTIHVLWPIAGESAPGAGANDHSVVLLLEWGAFRALLTGDAPAEVEERLADRVGPVHLLKVGHHGSRTSTSAAFLETISPSLALIPVGAGNSYGHPDPGVVERLERRGITILRSDLDATVEIRAWRTGKYSARTGVIR